ncbi:MAG: hypothetical protein ABSF59_09600 [Candidatus Sulfotelmatobacter sp.]
MHRTLTITTTGANAANSAAPRFFLRDVAADCGTLSGWHGLWLGVFAAEEMAGPIDDWHGYVWATAPARGGGSSSGGGGGGGTPAGSYTVTITGTGTDKAATTHSTTVTLTGN